MARSSLDEPNDRVVPLPEALFRTSETALRTMSVLWPIRSQGLNVGEWSIVIVNEHDAFSGKQEVDEEDLRLGVITPKTERSEDGYVVLSMDEFLKDVSSEESIPSRNGEGQLAKGGKRVEEEMASDLVKDWRDMVGYMWKCEEED